MEKIMVLSPRSTEKVVICMKWGTLYSAEYVNVLYSAVRRNITGPFRFVCLTEDPAGLMDGVEAFPIPDIGLLPQHWRGGGWPKFAVFKRDLYNLSGRCLFIDLDMVICSSIDPFFEHPSAFITTDMGPNWKPRQGTGAPEPGTCMFAFTIGEQGAILDQFIARRDELIARYKYEQEVVGLLASSMDYWPAEWVISFKRHLRQPVLLGLLLAPAKPPKTAKVLAFHGTPRPAELMTRGWWGVMPHVGRGPVDWMEQYWLENGGSVPARQ